MAKRDKTEQIRQQIIAATDDLLYHKGFNLMSFSDIADAAEVPRGNLYYYFKTKDEVLAAVIEHRLQQMRLMLDEWEHTIPTPLARLQRYARIPLNEMENVTRFGCPMGSLNTELGKSQPELQAIAKQQFDLFREWLVRQFEALAPTENAEHLALHLLVRTQGLATLAQIYHDTALVMQEVEALDHWLEGLAD
ncbi:TetR/AcrR family transcriptional regulator [Thiothrix subterranea]|uniref:TetR/AcrR family transcriptional regulator n=1 Tax=Thiothrix subterranea TaxID=2735563 RepID=A0AA51MIY6_9GAMM|nr:TetR/AcrR family transcriptional regulator [Thiothrix subterranea]MDQ5768686.1 TetR/AcrR family transcriptional regulator [Thiothrix subterranea]WML84838.1 TetR/AcrR family transcriptional regulator [Thiothrix subterranea]